MTILEALKHCSDTGERVQITYPGGASLSGRIEHDGDDEYVFLMPRPFTTPLPTFVIPEMIHAITIKNQVIFTAEGN